MRGARNEKGMVLLLVLVVVALLTSLVTEFAFSTLVDMRLTETFRDSTRAWYLAKGGVQAGRMIRQEDRNAFDHPDELWGIGVPSYPVGEDGVVSISLEDLSGRININLLVQGDNPLPVTIGRVYRLFRNLDLDEPGDLTAALIDWIDSGDDEYRILRLPDEQDINVTGAETTYYERLENPYRAKNAPFDSLDELALVRGFTPEVLQKVVPYLAVFGTDKINLNTASAEVLMAADDMIDRSAAEEILSRRLDQPFESPGEVTTIPRLDTLLHANFAVKSSMFQITAEAAVNDGTRRAVAVVSSDGRKVHYMKVD